MEMLSVDGKRVLLVLLDRDNDDLSWHCCCGCWASGGMENIPTTDLLLEGDDNSALAMTSRLSIKLMKEDKQMWEVVAKKNTKQINERYKPINRSPHGLIVLRSAIIC
jgi:hypothetical protein